MHPTSEALPLPKRGKESGDQGMFLRVRSCGTQILKDRVSSDIPFLKMRHQSIQTGRNESVIAPVFLGVGDLNKNNNNNNNKNNNNNNGRRRRQQHQQQQQKRVTTTLDTATLVKSS